MGKAERTREFIVEKTAPLFNRKGYAGTSMSDLTEATGLTKGAIYGNFENKDEVALAAFDYNLARMVQRVRALQTNDPLPWANCRLTSAFTAKACLIRHCLPAVLLLTPV